MKKISKSVLKPRMLKIFRQIEETKEEIIVTDHGKPVLKISPYTENIDETLSKLAGSVKEYKKPFDPVEFSPAL